MGHIAKPLRSDQRNLADYSAEKYLALNVEFNVDSFGGT